MRTFSIGLVLLFGIVGAVCTADAGVLYRVQYGNAQGNNNATPIISSSPLDVSHSGGILNRNHTVGSVRGVADNGILINEVEMFRNASNFGANGRPWVQTRVVIDDLIFFRTDDPLAAGTANIGIAADYSFSVENTNFRGDFKNSISFTNKSSTSTGDIILNGGDSTAGTLLWNLTNIPLNTPRTLTVQAYLELRLNQAFVPSITGIALSEVLFPTFILPEGIGVMSASFPLGTVPTPGAIALLGFGLFALTRLKIPR